MQIGLPVVATILLIPIVVPIVDHSFEYVMEPTLGSYLGLTFDHSHTHIQQFLQHQEEETHENKKEI